ncbi:nitroreductase family protein [Bordetella sp. BOR01]|uniref:nitroreductase family protein n=1 Tax=Bordetella sp. BOR01 TaxID=2854779 RepID=UPI001C43CD06|nr:nitroreductase family protein [Bordetella sp. BOR01]MBV7483085.1 nitroreductase family protein [Bordetella sp. BOR01]
MENALIAAIEQRTSANYFDPAHRIAPAQLERLAELATRAPTAFNLQNWRFIAVHTPAAKARLRDLAWGQAKVADAAVTFVVVGVLARHDALAQRLAPSVQAGFMPARMVPAWESAARGLYEDQPWQQRDEAVRSAALGASTLMLAGQALELASCPMSGFDAKGVAREFGLAADEVPVMLVAMGRAAAGNWPQKPRRPVSQVLELA